MFTLEDINKEKRGLEKTFERNEVVKKIKAMFPDCYEIPKPIRPSSKGTPDRQFLINGRFIAIETKNKTGKPTAKQIERIASIRKAGGIAFVARTWAEVEDILIKEGVIKCLK